MSNDTNEENIENNNKGVKFFLDTNKLPQPITFNFPDQRNYIFDKLDEIFEAQKKFKNQIDSNYEGQPFNCYNIPQGNYDLLDDITNIIEEAIECRRLIVPRKKWSKKSEPINRQQLLEELIDVSKFTLQAIIRLGYGAPDFYNGHKDKTKVNEERQENGY